MRRKTIVWSLGIGFAIITGTAGILGYRMIAERRFQAELDQAKRALAANRPNTALERLNALASRWPDAGEVLYLIGRCEIARGHPDRAEAAWGRIAPSDSPHFGLAAIEWAELDRERGRLAAAETRLRAVLAKPGGYTGRARGALVQLLVLEGRELEARRLFADGLGQHPDPIEALILLDKLEIEPYPIEAARYFLESAAKLAPDDDRVWLGRAHLAIRTGNIPQAESLLKTCLKRRPDDTAVLEMLLKCGLQAERPDLVAQAMVHLPAASLDTDRVNDLRAWAARLAGDRDAERRLLDEQPASPQILERLAELAIKAGNREQAATYRARRVACQNDLTQYRRRLTSPGAMDHPGEMARLAEKAGRPLDVQYWSARAGQGTKAQPGVSAQTLADALPDVVAALETLAKSDRAKTPRLPKSRPRFEDDAQQAGLRFVHESGSAAGRLIPPVTFSGGVGLLDFDRDRRLDVFLVQSGRFPTGPESASDGDRLFRNRGDGTFEDVTARAGLEGAHGYGHGVAVGDVDNDGFPDLFVTRWRSYALYRNRGDGTFEDVTKRWGLAGDRDWPTSAAFADLDNDGDLDLYVCHYIKWDEHDTRACVDPADPTKYNCNPRDFPSLPDHLLRNDGGRFVDATAEAGIVDTNGRGLGVVAADLDGDNRVDLFVANDMSANLLFINRGGLRFEERALEAGVAANAGGGYQAGMGVACGDLDGDGRFDLAVTNFYGESTSYFQNLGDGLFADRTAASGLQAPSRPLLGFGMAFFDADSDGRLDLLTVNGHIHDGRPLYPWKMPLQLLQGGPPGRLTEVSAEAGPPFKALHIARGLAVGDLDNDGRLDALVQVQDEPLIYLHNRSKGGRFIAFDLEGTRSNRDGVGATVSVITPDGRRHLAQRIGGGSYQSASTPLVQIGLGDATRAAKVEVLWPSGRLDRFSDLASDTVYRLREGNPRALPQAPEG
jgi:predicted Zn-dependent protease